MKRANHLLAALIVLLVTTGLASAMAAKSPSPHWEIKGEMSEACTCAVPCGCNFHGRPSHDYCWSIASLNIEKGHYGTVSLGGLHLVRGHGQSEIVWYIDDRANARQAAALQAIAAHISGRRGDNLRVEKAHIVQTVGDQGVEVRIDGVGGFRTDYLRGGDGKNPIVVENMTAWNVRHDIKGKTQWLRYKDKLGDQFDRTNTNANEGKFDWTDRTPWYI